MILKEIQDAFKIKKEKGCLNPEYNNLIYGTGYTDLWEQIEGIIELQTLRIMIDFGDSFWIKTGNGDPLANPPLPPLVNPMGIKALLLLAAQYYFKELGLLTSIPDPNQYQDMANVKIPIAFAKYLEYFAPYVDTQTGTITRYTVPVLQNYTGSLGYYSVDGKNPTANGSLSNNRLIKLICPSSVDVYSSTGQNILPEPAMAHLGTDWQLPTSSSPPPVPIALQAYYQNVATSAFLAKWTDIIRNGVSIAEIGRQAPDASAYSTFTNGSITNPYVAFNNEMAIILNADLDLPLSSVGNLPPYASGYPPNMFHDAGTGDTDSYTASGVSTILANSYFYLLANCTKYCSGTAHCLLRETEFKGCNSFVVNPISIDIAAFVSHISDTIQMNNVNQGSSPSLMSNNAMFGLVSACWTALLERVYRSSQLVNNQPNGYTQPSIIVWGGLKNTLKVPPNIATVVNAIGPVIIGGRVQVPVAVMSGPFDFAVSANGQWNPNYFNTITTPTGYMYQANLRTNQTSNPGQLLNANGSSYSYLTLSPLGNTYKYNKVFAISNYLFVQNGCASLPPSYGFGKWVQLPRSVLGMPSVMTSYLNMDIQQTPDSLTNPNPTQWQYPGPLVSNLWALSATMVKRSITHYTCVTAEDSSRALLLSPIVNTTPFSTGQPTTNLLKPLSDNITSYVTTDVSRALANWVNINIGEAPNATDMKQAQLGLTSDIKTIKELPGLEHSTKFQDSNEQYQASIKTYFPNFKNVSNSLLEGKVKPDYTDAVSNLMQIYSAGKSFVKSESGKAIIRTLYCTGVDMLGVPGGCAIPLILAEGAGVHT